MSSGIALPITLPIDLGVNDGVGIRLPITLPMTLSAQEVELMYKITLPIKLPMFFEPMEREYFHNKVPVSISVEYANIRNTFKVPMVEETQALGVKVPLTEYVWDFYGLVIEEQVLGNFSKTLTLLEEVRSRILFDVELLERNKIRIKWYGEAVPGVQIYRKMEVDEEWTYVGDYAWEDSEATIDLDNNEQLIKVIGINDSGESGETTIGESNYTRIDTVVEILLNRKVYMFNIDFTGKHTFNINF